MKEIFLLTPPFTQLNTPYPATAYLKGFLNTKNISSFQMDLGIEVILELFSKKGLHDLFDIAFKKESIISENSQKIFTLKNDYIKSIDDVIAFLQGKNKNFARQICSENFLPRASRFNQLDDTKWAFENSSGQDKAKHLATLYLEDLSDFIVDCIDENFGFSRYAERLGRSANSFDLLHEHLQKEPSYIDFISLKILDEKLKQVQPKLVGISVPFPGNLYSAFRCAQFIKKNYPEIKISMGGGFPTTELRSVSDPRVFDFFDYIMLDDGELSLELILSDVLDTNQRLLKRTFIRENGKVEYNNTSQNEDYKQSELGFPDYTDLFLDRYISVIEIVNPMHSLWSNGRWNKLTMAHGCYWGKCAFCDTTLSYIKDYEPNSAEFLADRIEQLISQTGERNFHFVDEAAPPALMKALAIEIIRRKLKISWWTNIRFEKSFTKDLCNLLKASGCIAISGGLEVASDRLLKLIQKGVSVEQVAQVTDNFTEAGIMVHAYLMYGFPSQTIQETMDSLEMVRQMFELDLIQSGFWHQFALTAHSDVGKNPTVYNIVPESKEITFAHNDIQFEDKTGIDHDQFSFGLKKSLYNYMYGFGFDIPVQEWFESDSTESKIPKTSIQNDYIQNCLEPEDQFVNKDSAQIIWLGEKPKVSYFKKTKKGVSREKIQLTFNKEVEVSFDKEEGEWFAEVLKKLSVYENDSLTFAQLKTDFEKQFENFELFWYSKPINTLRKNGLLVL
ncbi:MAG: radical SAM protein [Bacteroidales bacterium]|nr:radical SAM protein [Bacteroidales bacterium]